MAVNDVFTFSNLSGDGETPSFHVSGGLYLATWTSDQWGHCALHVLSADGVTWVTSPPTANWTSNGGASNYLVAGQYKWIYTGLSNAVLGLSQQPRSPQSNIGPPGPTGPAGPQGPPGSATGAYLPLTGGVLTGDLTLSDSDVIFTASSTSILPTIKTADNAQTGNTSSQLFITTGDGAAGTWGSGNLSINTGNVTGASSQAGSIMIETGNNPNGATPGQIWLRSAGGVYLDLYDIQTIDDPNLAVTKGYVDNAIASMPPSGGGIADAPSDGKTYARLNATWTPAVPHGGETRGNIIIGSSAAPSLPGAASGSANIVLGTQSGYSLNGQDNGVCIGPSAARTATGASWSVCIGPNAALSASSLSDCVVIGGSACANQTSGISNNVIIGANAQRDASSGNASTVIGYYAGKGGPNNTIIGYQAGMNAVGGWNTIIGAGSAATLTTGWDNFYLGPSLDAASPGEMATFRLGSNKNMNLLRATSITSTTPAVFFDWLTPMASYPNDASAAAGGVALNQIYRDGSAVRIRTDKTDGSGGVGAVTASTATTTITPGSNAEIVVTCNASSTFTIAAGSKDRQKLTLVFVQDATGNRTVSFDASVVFGTDIASFTASTAANKADYVGLEWVASISKWRMISFARGY